MLRGSSKNLVILEVRCCFIQILDIWLTSLILHPLWPPIILCFPKGPWSRWVVTTGKATTRLRSKSGKKVWHFSRRLCNNRLIKFFQNIVLHWLSLTIQTIEIVSSSVCLPGAQTFSPVHLSVYLVPKHIHRCLQLFVYMVNMHGMSTSPVSSTQFVQSAGQLFVYVVNISAAVSWLLIWCFVVYLKTIWLID